MNCSWGKKKALLDGYWVGGRKRVLISMQTGEAGSQRGDEQPDLSRKRKTRQIFPSSLCPTWHSRNWAGKVLDWVHLQYLQLHSGTNSSVPPESQNTISGSKHHPNKWIFQVKTSMQNHSHWNMELWELLNVWPQDRMIPTPPKLQNPQNSTTQGFAVTTPRLHDDTWEVLDEKYKQELSVKRKSQLWFPVP